MLSKKSNNRKQEATVKRPTTPETLRRYGILNIKRTSNVKKPSALSELIGAILIYGLCVSLPTFFGIIFRFYQNNFLFGNANELVNSTTQYNNLQDTQFKALQDHRQQHSGPFTLNHIRNLVWEVLFNILSFLSQRAETYMRTGAMSDAQFVVLLSIMIALVRVLLIHLLVPRYLAHKEVIFRCKSSHMLSSSEYQFGSQSQMIQDIPFSPPPSPKKQLSSFHRRTNSIHEHLNKTWMQTCDSVQLSLGVAKKKNESSMTKNAGLFSAPRYATAIFRLCFCAASCAWALYKFHGANFWPIWVGGFMTSQTKNCWDLSGSVASSLDTDFDHQNTSLRYFYLSQASYQLHSLCFHILSIMFLLFTGGFRGNKGGFVSMRSSMKSYLRPMIEHLLYLTLIVSSFIFSGSRRLGAIAIFSLEASSLYVQMLQICISAPEGSNLHNSQTIKIIHQYLTIPVFVYCRFFVLPFIVLYSSLFESLDWIRQIEHAMAPGCGAVIYYFFNGLLLLTFGLNLVYLRRLLFHPYIQKIS